jgi:puromycin-sensitive aminopeptidase
MRPGLDAAGAPAPADDPYRLPRAVEPVTYRLTVTPSLEQATFEGTVDIDVRVHEQVDEIVLNAAELDIRSAIVRPPAGDPIAADVTLDEKEERARIELPGPLAKGDATVSLTFTGVINDRLRGFYRSTFTDPEGRTRTIATTQMESTDARRAFPCWDEPDRKATFEITLVVDEGLLAVSNAPTVEDDAFTAADGSPKRRVRFAPTMKMSTYLVAFVVGPLEATDPVDAGGTPVRVVHTPGRGHLTDFAVDVARHALDFFTGYFGIPYPGEKLDLAAIPDFAHGAMENLGCVTFRETALLVDPAAASRVELERIADVVHHEIAHMWFGDLVTMEWWEGIWLNEAFATFMELLATDHYRPGWQRWSTFGVERDMALHVDGLHTTRPIEYPVGSPEDADGMFDVLTYEKGASVLRMLEQYLGADAFRDGVRHYLESHAYGNTVTGDLWNALEEVTGEPVRAVAESWILQGGHPLVRVKGTVVTQEPFAYLPEARRESAIGNRWLVPLLVRQVGVGAGSGGTDGGVERLLLTDEALTLGADGATAPATTADAGTPLANAGGWGCYRVAYANGQLEALGDRLDALTSLERYDLFSDSWALVLSGRLELGDLLDLAAHLHQEEDPGIYRTVTAALDLVARIGGDAIRPQLVASTRTLLGGRMDELGWDSRTGEAERIPSLRSTLIATLGTIGKDERIRAEAARRFDAAHSGGPAIDPNLEGAVLTVVADLERDGDYETVLQRYRHPCTPQEETRYLMALTAFPDVDRCLQTFQLALTEARSADGFLLVRGLLANRVGGPAVWERVKTEWRTLLDRLPDVHQAPMLATVRLLCTDATLAGDVDRFLTEHPVEVAPRTVEQALEQLAVNVRFAEHLRRGDRLSVALGRVSGG